MPSATRYFMLSLAVGALAPLLIATGPDSAQAFPARGERTFTVSPDGDDGEDGSELRPWKTLQHAAQRAQPGDTVHVQSGTYAGFALGWDGPQGGTAGRPIAFRAKSRAVIAARNPKSPDGILLEGASYVVVE